MSKMNDELRCDDGDKNNKNKSENNQEDNESYYKECMLLRQKILHSEEQNLLQASEFNQKECLLQSEIVKSQMQTEKCEASKKELQFQLANLKKKLAESNRTNKQRQITLSKDIMLHTDNETMLQNKLDEAHKEIRKMKEENDHLTSARSEIENEKSGLADILEYKTKELESQSELTFKLEQQLKETCEKLSSAESTLEDRDKYVHKLLATNQNISENESALKNYVKELQQRCENLENIVKEKSKLEEEFSKQQHTEADLKVIIDAAHVKLGEIEQVVSQLRDENNVLSLQLQATDTELNEKNQEVESLMHQKQQIESESTGAYEDCRSKNFALQDEINNIKKKSKETKDSFFDFTKGICEVINSYNDFDDKSFKNTNVSQNSSKRLYKADIKHLKRDYPVFLNNIRALMENYSQIRNKLKGDLNKLNSKNKDLHVKCRKNSELFQSQSAELEKTQQSLKSCNAKLLEIRNKQKKQNSQNKVTNKNVAWINDNLNSHVEKCTQLHKDIETIEQRHIEEAQIHKNFLCELYLLISNIDGEKCCITELTLHEITVKLREKMDKFMQSYLNMAKQSYTMEKFNAELQGTVEGLQSDHKMAIERLAEECKRRENQSVENRKELEQHFEAYIGELQTKLQNVQSMNDEGWANAMTSQSVNSNLQTQVEKLQEDQLLLVKFRKSVSAASWILLGTVFSSFKCKSNLSKQVNFLSKSLRSHEDNLLMIRSLEESLSHHIEDKNNLQKSSSSFKSAHPLIRFRVAVIAVLAGNRLKNISSSDKIFSCSFQHHSVSALEPKSEENTSLYELLTNSDENFVKNIVKSTKPIEKVLQDKSNNRDSQLKVACKNTFVKLAEFSQPYFEHAINDNQVFRPQQLLHEKLKLGLEMVLRRQKNETFSIFLSPKQLTTKLKDHFIHLTKMLQQAEIDKLQMDNENCQLSIKIENNQKEMASMKENLNEFRNNEYDVRMKLIHCDDVTKELASALKREKTSQSLLQEQSDKIKEMKGKLKNFSKSERQNLKTLNEAVSDLTDARLEVKRKFREKQHFEKKVEVISKEKDDLEKTLNQAKLALKKAVGEKNCITNYFKTIENKMNDLESDKDVFEKLEFHHNKLIEKGGTGMQVATRTVNEFIRIQSNAVKRINHLEDQLSSYKDHINQLKMEFHGCYVREHLNKKNVESSYEKENMNNQLSNLQNEFDSQSSVLSVKNSSETIN